MRGLFDRFRYTGAMSAAADTAELLSLPDDLLELLDEFQDARQAAGRVGADSCGEQFSCPAETLVNLLARLTRLMK